MAEIAEVAEVSTFLPVTAVHRCEGMEYYSIVECTATGWWFGFNGYHKHQRVTQCPVCHAKLPEVSNELDQKT